MADATETDLTFKKDTVGADARTITVDSPFDGVKVQTLVNAIREYEAELDNLDREIIITATGKDTIVAGEEFTGITMTLLNDWRLAFEARAGPTYEQVTTRQGNLIAINAFDDNPIYATAFTQVSIRQSTSPTVINAEVGDFWDALRADHMVAGSFGEGVPVDSLATDSIDSDTLAASAVNEIVDQVWDETRSEHTTPGSFGEGVNVVSMNTDVVDAAALATDGLAAIADKILARNIAGGSDGGRDVTSALRVIRNRVTLGGSTLTVYQENDTTVAWTATVSTAARDPFSGVDPA